MSERFVQRKTGESHKDLTKRIETWAKASNKLSFTIGDYLLTYRDMLHGDEYETLAKVREAMEGIVQDVGRDNR